jgi:hypothetical protein
MVKQYDAFWKAFLITSAIFMLGVFAGVWLDSARVEEVRQEYVGMEIQTSDARIQTLYYQTFKNSTNFCGPAIQENLRFADKVYQEGLRIDAYEKVNKLAPSLISDKKRYVLLKLQFWLNCIELKSSCDAKYVNVVYFYSHYNTSAQENVQSAVLMDLKNKYGADMMLIPLPADLNITSIDLIKSQYGITETPTILINERIKLAGLQEKNGLSGIVARALEA